MPIELASHVPGYRRKIGARSIIYSILGTGLALFIIYGIAKREISYLEKQVECEESTAQELAERQRQRTRRCLEWPPEASAIMTVCMTMASDNRQQKCVATPNPPLYPPEDLSPCLSIPPMGYQCGPADL